MPVIDEVKPLLEAWRKASGNPTTGFLFPNQQHNPICLDALARHAIIPKLNNGLRWKGWHAGRRLLGTTLRTLTGKSNAGKEALGHATTQVTEDHYEKEMPQEVITGMGLVQQEVAKKLQEREAKEISDEKHSHNFRDPRSECSDGAEQSTKNLLRSGR